MRRSATYRDPGVEAAIKAAGGLRALARLLGISHNSVLEWTKIPSDRILEIETLTGVARERLRPDLYRIPQATSRRAKPAPKKR